MKTVADMIRSWFHLVYEYARAYEADANNGKQIDR